MNRLTIIMAIQGIGGINPRKCRNAGKWAEWLEIDKATRMQVFRKSSCQGPDSVAEQIGEYHPEFGVFDENGLLEYLSNPRKMKLDALEASDYDQLVAEVERLRNELALLKGETEKRIGFVHIGNGRYRTYEYFVPVSDVPF